MRKELELLRQDLKKVLANINTYYDQNSEVLDKLKVMDKDKWTYPPGVVLHFINRSIGSALNNMELLVEAMPKERRRRRKIK